MKKFLSIAIIMAIFAPSFVSAKFTSGYIRSNGTYVAPSYRTNSDSVKWNNYSAKGNYNPYSWKKWYKSWY